MTEAAEPEVVETQAFAEGYRDQFNGSEASQCPYRIGTIERSEYMRGRTSCQMREPTPWTKPGPRKPPAYAQDTATHASAPLESMIDRGSGDAIILESPAPGVSMLGPRPSPRVDVVGARQPKPKTVKRTYTSLKGKTPEEIKAHKAKYMRDRYAKLHPKAQENPALESENLLGQHEGGEFGPEGDQRLRMWMDKCAFSPVVHLHIDGDPCPFDPDKVPQNVIDNRAGEQTIDQVVESLEKATAQLQKPEMFLGKIQFMLRPGLEVSVHHIPSDLTTAEADKISRLLQLFVL